jgi:hypothetical protein
MPTTKNINAEKIQGYLSLSVISATTYQNLPLGIYGTGLTFDTGNYNLTLDGQNGTLDTISLSILASDLTVTGGTYDPNTGVATFTNNTGGTFSVIGFLTGFTDTYVSGGTYSAGTITFTNTSGGTFNVTGLTSTFNGDYLPLSGGTVTGNTVFTSGLTITGDTIITDSTGTSAALNTSTRELIDAASSVSLDWRDRLLKDSVGVYSTDWANRYLIDNAGTISVDWQTGVLNDITTGSATLNWNSRLLYNSNGTNTVNWESGLLYDYVGQTSVDWNQRILHDQNTYQSIDYNTRYLIKSDGSTTSFDWENGILTSQTNIESSTISATTYLNLPTSTDYYVTGGTYSFTGGTVTLNRNDGNNVSITGFNTNDTWTVELINALSVDFYAPYNLSISSVTNILGSPTITLYDDNVSYSLGAAIGIGSKITVVASVTGVTNLNLIRT